MRTLESEASATFQNPSSCELAAFSHLVSPRRRIERKLAWDLSQSKANTHLREYSASTAHEERGDVSAHAQGKREEDGNVSVSGVHGGARLVDGRASRLSKEHQENSRGEMHYWNTSTNTMKHVGLRLKWCEVLESALE